jgi:folate-binding protein YgfZ
MFLNTQGRILFDTFIIKKTANEYFIDCDANLSEKLVKHLKIYRVRRKITVELMPNVQILALFDPADQQSLDRLPDDLNLGLCYKDTRVKNLGFRVILNSSNCSSDLPESDHKSFRYSLGIPEGAQDIPLGKCNPLEFNAHYMHGVSFQKGCYIGQELTARTHHTGVIRKRIMPLKLSEDFQNLELEAVIVNQMGKNVGKIKGVHDKSAIGLMRIEECKNAEKLVIKDTEIQVQVQTPNWWPIEAPKTPQNKI